jgi:cephalosporin-C deacetylase-like acetyl esterase
MRKRVLTSLALLLACTAAAIAQTTSGDMTLKVVPERDTGVYKAGEPIRFLITASDGGKPATGQVAYELKSDTAKVLESASARLTEGKAVVTCTLKEPGTVMITVKMGDDKKPPTALAGATVDPFAIKPSLPAPKDFKAFWDAQKESLAKVPMNPRLTPVDEPRKVNYGPEVECFDLQLDCTGGKPVRGYFAKPKGAKPKSLPAVLSLHSAGIKDSSLQAAWNGAKRGNLSVDINAHGLPNGKPAAFYTGLRNGELRGYSTRGMDSPETFYFYGMYMRIVRAIDFLTTQPEWDGKTLIVSGSSQGGGQALVAAGIDSRVTELRATVPAFCDQTGYLDDRKPGWPGRRPKNPKQQRTLQYYDACHFAAQTKAKAKVVVGLIDTTCPPTGILAAYNQLKGEKSITILPLRGHGGSRETNAMAKDPKYTHSHPAVE